MCPLSGLIEIISEGNTITLHSPLSTINSALAPLNTHLSHDRWLRKRAVADSLQQPFVLNAQLLLSVHGALPAILALALETDGAVDQSEQGVIAADAHVDTGVDVGASLANQNVASQNELTVGTLHAQELCLGGTTVLGRTAALVVS